MLQEGWRNDCRQNVQAFVSLDEVRRHLFKYSVRMLRIVNFETLVAAQAHNSEDFVPQVA